MRVQPSITSREVNQNSSQVFRAVREDHVIIPITYGASQLPVAYIVPAEVMQSRAAALEAVSLATRRGVTRNGRSLRESFAPVSSPHSRADEILAGMRSDRV